MVSMTERALEAVLVRENEEEICVVEYLGNINVAGTNKPMYLVYTLNKYEYPPERIEGEIKRSLPERFR